MELLFYGAVIGKPIGHSKSPQLYRAALKTRGIRGSYFRLAVESAEEALALMSKLGLTGINITAPFKENMAQLVAQKSDQATCVGAVNTVVRSDLELRGFNTDVAGVVGAIAGVDSAYLKKKVIVIGAGGAARAVLAGLVPTAEKITIVNRTTSRAQILAEQFTVEFLDLADSRLHAVVGDAALIVDTTSAEDFMLPAAALMSHHLVLSAQYRKLKHLQKIVQKSGARFVDGAAWLAHQAYAAFELFTQQPAPRQEMAQALAVPADQKSRHLVLLGVMGAGKSTVGAVVAQKLNRPFIDLDLLIEARAGQSVTQIFNAKGEGYFRQLEAALLAEVCDRASPQVIAGGGGLVLREENRATLARATYPVMLWAGEAELAARLKGETNTRPLLQQGDLPRQLREIMRTRREFYFEVIELLVPTDGRSAAQVAERILFEWAHV